MAHDAFISYSSQDRPIALAVCDALEHRKVRCWIAPRDVLPGIPWGEAIIEAITESHIFILVYSNYSNDSVQVMREVERAVSKGIPIIPFRVQDVPPSKTLEYFISGTHWLDALTPPLSDHLGHLSDTVHLWLTRSAAKAKAIADGLQELPTELEPRAASKVSTGSGPDLRQPPRKRITREALALGLVLFLGLVGWAVWRVVGRSRVEGRGGTETAVIPNQPARARVAEAPAEPGKQVPEATVARSKEQPADIKGSEASPKAKEQVPETRATEKLAHEKEPPVGEIRQLNKHTSAVNGVAFAPDGRHALTSGDDRALLLWDVETGQVLRHLTGHSGSVVQAVFSADGRRALSGGIDKALRYWDVETGRQVSSIEGPADDVWCVAYSPDGRRALSGSCGHYELERLVPGDLALRLWDVGTGRLIRRLEGHTAGVKRVAFCPDGRRALSGGNDMVLRLWDLETGRQVRKFEGHTDYVNGVAVSGDGRRALSGGGDKTLRLWDVETGEELRRFEGHTGPVNCVALSHDGRRVLSAASDRTVRLWDAETGEELRRFEGHTDDVMSVALSRDGRFALSGSGGRRENGKFEVTDTSVRLWNVETGKELARFVDTAGVSCVDFSDDGRRAVVGGGNSNLRILNAETLKELARFQGHLGLVRGAAFSPDGHRLLSGAWDKSIRLWDVETGREIPGFGGPRDWVTCVALSSDGRLALSGSSYHSEVTKEGRRLISNDLAMRLWDLSTGRFVRVFEGHTNGVRSVAFSSDGRRALSGSGDKTLRLWAVETGAELRRFEGHSDYVTGVALSADGQRAVSSSGDGTVRLWDVGTGEELRRFEGHTQPVMCVALSPDGRRILSGGQDKTVRLWDVSSADEIDHFAGHTNTVLAVAFSPDGRRALSGSIDQTARYWALPKY